MKRWPINSYAELLRAYRLLKTAGGGVGGPLLPRRQRDLTLVNLFKDFYLVIGCDSDGGIGPKENDVVKVPGFSLGRAGARVALMEVLASGAMPLIVIDTLSVEMDPTGLEIIAGIRAEVAGLGLDPQVVITGSTEDNVPTSQTGLGVTVIGLARERDLKPGGAQVGDIVACIGLPKSGPQDKVSFDDPEIVALPLVRWLSHSRRIHDVLPVGSHGLKYEATIMAGTAGCCLQLVEPAAVDLQKSAGPSTCVLVALSEKDLSWLRRASRAPLRIIGSIF